MLLQNVIDHTNARLQDWYANVKREYGVSGKGTCKLENNFFHIHYEENGVKCVKEIEWHPNYKIDTIFNIWAEEADPEKDKIEDSPINVLDMNPEEKMPEFLPENKVSNIRLQALGLALDYLKAKSPNMLHGFSHRDVLAVAKEFEEYLICKK